MAYLNDMVSVIFDESSPIYVLPPQTKKGEELNDLGKAQRRVQTKIAWDMNTAIVKNVESYLNGIKEARGRVTMRDVLRELQLKPTNPQKDILNDGWDRKSGELKMKIAGKPKIKFEGMVIEIYPKIKKLEEEKKYAEDRGISHLVRKMCALFKK